MNKILIQDQRTEQSAIVSQLVASWVLGPAAWKRVKMALESGERVVKSGKRLISDYDVIIQERTS